MEEVKKRALILNPQRMGLAEQLRQDWVVNAEEGTVIEDVLEPGYWSHMASQMQPYDHVEVRLETGEWILELIVTSVGRNWAMTHVKAKHDMAPSAESMPPASKYKVKWRGVQHKHCVVRVSDNEILQAGCSTAKEASEWMANYERATQT